MSFHSLRWLYDGPSRVVETTFSAFAILIKAMEFIPDVVINRGIYSKNNYENNVSRDPGQGKAVPKRPYRQIAVCPFWHIGAGVIDEGQRCHQEGKYHPKYVCIVAIWIESTLTTRMPRPEYV
jgi:hypothetical protein